MSSRLRPFPILGNLMGEALFADCLAARLLMEKKSAIAERGPSLQFFCVWDLIYTRCFFVASLFVCCLSVDSNADEKPAPAAVAQAFKSSEKKPSEAATGTNPNRKEQDPLVILVRALSPEQKARLLENIKAWQQLSPDIKQALRARDKVIKKTLADDIQAALEGTQLTPEQREQFEKRYREERRKLEANLRTEMEARRKAALEEMTSRLKESVAAPAGDKNELAPLAPSSSR
jgi:hypothetical protein